MTEASPDPGRSRLLVVLILMVLVVTALVFGLQTPFAFQSVWLPAASRALGGEVAAESGRLSLAGALEAKGLILRSPDLDGEIDHIQVALAPWASLAKRHWVVDSLELSTASLRFAASEPETEGSEGSPPVIEVRHGVVEKTTLEFETADGKMVAGPAAVTVDDWAYPESGTFRLSVPVEWKGSEGLPARLHAELSGQLVPRASAADPAQLAPGEASAFELTLRVDAEEQKELLLKPSVLSLEAKGGIAKGGKQVRLGRAEATWVEDDAQRLRLVATGELLPEAALDLDVEAENLSHTARWTTARALIALLDGAHIEGGLQLAGRFREPKVVPDLRLSLSGEDDPIGLHATGSLRWHNESTGPQVVMEPLTLAATRNAQPMGGNLELRGTVRPGGDTELRFQATAFDLLPWLRASGFAAGRADAFELAGTLSAVQSTTTLRVDGQLDAKLASQDVDGEVQMVQATLTPEFQSSDASTEAKVLVRAPAGEASAMDVQGSWVASSDPTVPARAELDLRALDLTPWAALFEAEQAETEGESTEPVPAESSEAETASAPSEIDLRVGVGQIRLRELEIRGGEVTGRVGRTWEFEARGVGMADGSVDGKAWGGRRGGSEEVGWDVQLGGMDTALLLAGLMPDADAKLEGVLEMETEGEGRGTDMETALDAVNGSLNFQMQGGSAEGLSVQDALMEELDIADFSLISFENLHGDYPIEEGQLLIDDLVVDGTVVQLVATGEVSAKDLDLTINPRLGPDLQGLVPDHLVGGLLGTATDLLALPIVVRVSGAFGATEVSVQPAAPALLGDLFTGVKEIVQEGGAVGESLR